MSAVAARSSQYSGQCAACLYRNEIIVQNAMVAQGLPMPETKDDLKAFLDGPHNTGPTQITKESLWYWCSATGSCNTGQQSCSDPTFAARCVSGELFRAAPGTHADGRDCPCTTCFNNDCLSDYVNPACHKGFEECGCVESESSLETIAGNKVENRVSGRGQLVCPFAPINTDTTARPTGPPPEATPRKLDERRKAQILLHQHNSARLTAKQKWSRLVRGKGPRGPRAWASQTQRVTSPNTRPCRGPLLSLCRKNPSDPKCQGCFAPKEANPNVLVCTGKGPKHCSPASSCDVPRSADRSQNHICMDKSVPLTRYRHREVLLSAVGSTWPQTRWRPGFHGFPVGKAGSSDYEQQLAVEEDAKRRGGLFAQQVSFQVSLPAVGGGNGGHGTLCNRFSCEELKDMLVCLDSTGEIRVHSQDKLDSFQFGWRVDSLPPYDVHGVTGQKFQALVGSDTREFGGTPCTTGSDWGGINAAPPGPAGTVTVMEPGDGGVHPGTWERAVLDAIAGGHPVPEDGPAAAVVHGNNSDYTCCGPGNFFPLEAGETDPVRIGDLLYNGALTWAANRGVDTNNTSNATVPLLPAPNVQGPGGEYEFQSLVGEAPAAQYPGGLVSDTSPFCDTASGPILRKSGIFYTTTAKELKSIAPIAWASGRGPGEAYTGSGCGQPFTVSRWGPPTAGATSPPPAWTPPGAPDELEYECPAVNSKGCGDKYTTDHPSYVVAAPPGVSSDDKQNPHRVGGAWAPACFNCDPDATSNDPAGISASGRYITITFNFGAYSGGYEELISSAGPNKKQGGMGQWGRWRPLGDDGKEASPSDVGLFPELYTVTWYIDISSLSPAKTHDRRVDAWCVVVGKPSAGQYIDPRPIVGAYVKTDIFAPVGGYPIDTGRAGGGLLGYGGSVVGTQAGGLGVRGCTKKPAIDIDHFPASVSITLCK